VIINLHSNALEAIGPGEQGTIHYRVRRHEDRPDEFAATPLVGKFPDTPYISLQVVDSGEGMNTDTLRKAFTPFYSTRHPGRGLGLEAVKQMAKRYNAAIYVLSEPDRGTTFSLLFPTVPMEG
jgi:signal transduction histidine kinase